TWFADSVFIAAEEFYRVADRVLPRYSLWVQVVIHIKDRKIDIAHLLERLLRHVRIQHNLRPGENHRIRMRFGYDLLLNQGGKELRIGVFLSQLLEIDRAKIQAGQSLAKRGEINAVRPVLAVQHLLFLHIERDYRKPANAGLARDLA